MIGESVQKYVEDFILKSGEELDWNPSAPNERGGVIEAKIIKRSERTYRIMGLLSFSIKPLDVDSRIDRKLKSLAFTKGKKVNLDDHDPLTFKWLEDGWVLKEVRLEKDGKTVRSSHYRMGFRLYQYEQLELQKKAEHNRNEFLKIKHRILECLSIQSNKYVGRYDTSGFQKLIKIIDQLNEDEFSISPLLPEKWSMVKRLRYLHFISAFCQLSLQKEEFDWKEIGAAYFQKIGGSKEFDSYKLEFINLLEDWANVPVNQLGLTSLGQITPVFFAGQLTGRYATYHWGPVHSLTNLSIADEDYATSATTLWLVENRSILTRMAAKGDFLKETDSLILCVDGHLRSAHKKAISQILSNSKVEQVIIWCDYDQDGLMISNEINLVVSQYYEGTLKFVLPDQSVISEWYQYEQHVTSFLRNNQMEQEQMIGGADQWERWLRN